ncbi:uncharacterized protein cubi_02650 [Cryptosporidium ubiquitum]|uniref:Uncharacterized protein n=1 Tax=Cryptosporidium ubiquitum TaxID=857276 RepID=A0A1J4MGS7_9CRYT|nr:uncharacterized protein cubi_02650 [Cryptosporidium ubiquitum]OII73438.1 hypothetical protein cubi_02650 [Cryptosporidium ubiquitum]
MNSFHSFGDGEEISGRMKVNKRALLVSGESEDFKGCTNDVIEYAILLSNIYQFKEIRILLSEISEMLYGNFISLALNRINGAVVQIVRLSKKSLKEGFQWLISMEENPVNQNYYAEFSNIYGVIGDNLGNGIRNGLDYGMNFPNTFYDLVFVYCGPVIILKDKQDFSNSNKNDNELIEKDEKKIDDNNESDKKVPFFVISKGRKDDSDLYQTINKDLNENDYISFSEFDRIISESNSNNKGNLTCFLDCNYSYLFLSNYTKGEEYSNIYENAGFNHHRISTMPQLHNDHVKLVDIQPKKVSQKKKRLSVIILGSCSSPKQVSQEIKVCSNNGIGLSIIYRGLFSYCVQTIIRYNFANIVDMGNSKIQIIPRITLKFLIEEISRIMFHYSTKNQLKNQIPILLASPGISTKDQILLNNSSIINYANMVDFGKGFLNNNVNNVNKGEFIDTLDQKNNTNTSKNLSPSLVHFGSINKNSISSYNTMNPSQFSIKNLNMGNKRIYNNGIIEGGNRLIKNTLQPNNKGIYMHQIGVSGVSPNSNPNSNLMQEINQLRSELCYLKQTINSENIARNISYAENNYNRMNGYQSYCPVQIFNSDTIFKKSVKPSSINHHRTFTSK